MKIVFVTQAYPPFSIGGVEVYAAELSNFLKATDEVFVFTAVVDETRPIHEIEDHLIDNVHIRTINKRPRYKHINDLYFDNQVDQAFLRYLEETDADIVHIHHLRHLSNNIVNIAKNRFQIPVVYTMHMPWLFDIFTFSLENESQVTEDERHCYKLELKRVTDSIDIFLSPSKFMIEEARKAEVAESKLHHLPFGHDPSQIKYKTRKFRKDSPICFGFMGRVSLAKGVWILIDAFLQMTNKSAQLKIYGSLDSDTQSLKNNQPANVQYMGEYNKNDINGIFEEVDVIVLPSITSENYPIVIQEAILGGICTVASDVGGVAELIQHEKTGFLFTRGNQRQLVRILNRIADNPYILNHVKPLKNRLPTLNDHVREIRKHYMRLLYG